MASVSREVNRQHKSLMIKLFEMMDPNDQTYKHFIFCLRSYLPEGMLSRVQQNPSEVFCLMEQRGIIKAGDYCVLKEALNDCGYINVLDILKNEEECIARQMRKRSYDDGQVACGSSNTAAAGPLSSPATSETDMFFRMAYLLVDVGSQVLRQLFRHHTVTPTCTLDQYLVNNRTSIDRLHRKKILFQSQMDIMFPPSGTTNLEAYDITLLSALFNNIVGPPCNEKTLIKSLKDSRNEIYAHVSSCKMNIKEYQTCWSSVSSTLISLSQHCGDPNFENQILLEIQRIQVTTIPAGSYLNILHAWFNKVDKLEDKVDKHEDKLNDVDSRLRTLESKETSPKSDH